MTREFLASAEHVIKALRAGFSDFIVGAALATVSFCSGFISYTHIAALTEQLGGNWKTAHLMPLAVDGQIVIGSRYFMDGRNWWQKSAGLVFGVLPGIGESLFANWESGIVHGLLAAAWSTVPAQAFACSAVLFERWLASRRQAADAGAAATETAGALTEPSPQAMPSAPGPEPSAVPVHVLSAAPGPLGWGWEGPLPVPAVVAPQRPARPTAVPSAVPAVPDTRLLLPEDEQELAALVRSTARNELFRTYQVSKTGADKLKARYTAEEAMTNVA